MKNAKFFLLLAMMALMLSVSAFSQNTAKPSEESLSDVQSWLANALTKSGGYQLGNSLIRMSDVKFDGCKMSYQQFNTPLFETTRDSDLSQPLSNRTSTLSVVVTIDLKELDTRRLALRSYNTRSPLSTSDAVQKILIYPIGDKESFRYAGGGDDVQTVKWGLKNGVTMVVKDGVAEQIKDKLAEAASLCRAIK
jgi:hypothetical protein